jgi:hypothetical protein
MSKKIIFKINKNGDVLIDKVEGYGSECLQATKFIEGRLGSADESSRKLTSEFEELPPTEMTEVVEH